MGSTISKIIKYLLLGLIGCLIYQTPQYLIPKIALLCIFLYCIKRGIKELQILNPYYLFAIVPFSLMMYNPAISDVYFIDIKNSTWLFAIVNMIAFLVAMELTTSYSDQKDTFLCNDRSLIKSGWILFFLSVVGTFISPLRSTFRLFVYPAIACVLKSKSKNHITLMLISWFLLNMNSLTKSLVLGLLILLAISVIKYFYDDTRPSFKLLFMLLIGGLIMYQMFTIKRYLADGGTFIDYISGGYIQAGLDDEDKYAARESYYNWEYFQGLLSPFMYLTTPWVNLQHTINIDANHTYGLWLFKPLLGWLQLDDNFSEEYILTPYSSFNTYTYLTVLYKDFGYWGAWVVSMILGWFVKRNYNSFLRSDSPLTLSIYSLTALATFQMYFSNHFFQLSYPITIVVIIFIYRKISSLFNHD